MSDILNQPYAERFVDPDEAGLAAAYTFGEGELATWGRYTNKCRATGAAYDLTTRAGVPIVGQGGGVYASTTAADPNNYLARAFIPVGNSNFSYTVEHEMVDAALAQRNFVQNSPEHKFWSNASGQLRITTNFEVTNSITPYSLVGRGPYRADLLYDGTQQHCVVNGLVADSDNVAPTTPAAGFIAVGFLGTTRLAKVYNIRRTVAQARASYVRDFARRVVYQWTPRDVGEGPAGGIATGAVGDTWNCILGDATLKFVWMTEPRLRQKQLALTGVNNQSPCRLEFPHTRMPSFGTWRWGMVARSLAATPEVYLAQLPRQTHAAAGSGCYWGRIAVTGGYWTITWYRENGAAMLTRINTSAAAALGDIVEAAVSRAVDGTWRADVGVNGNWANQGVNAANDVTYLSSNFVGVQPNSGHVLGVVRHQGEMTPGEFPRSDWYAPSLWSLVW